MFSCEFCEISKNTFFTEHFRATASVPNVSFYVVIKSETHEDKAIIKVLDKEKSGPKESEFEEPTDKNDIKYQENNSTPNAQNALGKINNKENSKESSISKAPETKKSNQLIPSPNVSFGILSNTNDQIDKPPICHITDQQDVNQNQQNEDRTNEDKGNLENEDKDSGKVIPVNTDLLKPKIMTPFLRPGMFFGYIHIYSSSNDNISLMGTTFTSHIFAAPFLVHSPFFKRLGDSFEIVYHGCDDVPDIIQFTTVPMASTQISL